jgi:hypothetical protein
MAKPGVSALIPPMRAMIDMLRGLVLALLVFQAAAPAAAGAAGGPPTVSCLGTVVPGEDDEDHGVHAACWACCTAPTALRAANIPTHRATAPVLTRSFAAEAPRRAAAPRPPARGPPALS